MTIQNIKIAEMMAILEEAASKGTKFIDMSLEQNKEGKDIIIIHASVPKKELQHPFPLKIQTEI